MKRTEIIMGLLLAVSFVTHAQATAFNEFNYTGHVTVSTDPYHAVGSAFSFHLFLAKDMPPDPLSMCCGEPYDPYYLAQYINFESDTLADNYGIFSPWNTNNLTLGQNSVFLNGEVDAAFVSFLADTNPNGRLDFSAFAWGNDYGFSATALRQTPEGGSTFALFLLALASLLSVRFKTT